MLREFKEFAMKGNVLDMAIGVIIGGAFGKIVSSLVSDVLMPPLGLLMGKVDFSSLFIVSHGTALIGRGKGRWGADAQLRSVFAKRLRLYHYCLCHFHASQASQPVQERGPATSSARTTGAQQ